MADAEIEAMTNVADALVDLDEQARERVLHWAAARYGLVAAVSGTQVGAKTARDQQGRDSGQGGEFGSDRHEDCLVYQHFAELFAAASPRTNDEKALVAAYWVQVHEGHEQWPSRLLSNELKNLGHRLPNITDALTSNINKQPQRIIQLRKSGSAKQANKAYKATTAGITYVEQMLGPRDD